jgi:hypothetical protein
LASVSSGELSGRGGVAADSSDRLLARNHPGARTELLHVLMLPDFERADRIGEFWCYPQSAFAELLIGCEEDRTLRAVLVGMLWDMKRRD